MKTLEELKNLIDSKNTNELERKVLVNNYKAVMYNDDVINAVIEAVNKYAGKKIGDATMKKINDELDKVVSGLRIYFVTSYCGKRDEITISRSERHYWSYAHDVKIYAKYNEEKKERNFFDENKNFVKISRDNINIGYQTKYIEDINGYLDTKKKQFEAAKKLEEDYKKICDLFDNDKVNGIEDLPHLYIRRFL